MTPQSGLQSLFGGGGAGAQQDQPQAGQAQATAGAGPDLGAQIQQLQIQAMMIARSNPATAPMMRQIIQLSQAASQAAAQGAPASQGGGMTAGPQTGNY